MVMEWLLNHKCIFVLLSVEGGHGTGQPVNNGEAGEGCILHKAVHEHGYLHHDQAPREGQTWRLLLHGPSLAQRVGLHHRWLLCRFRHPVHGGPLQSLRVAGRGWQTCPPC